MWIEQIEIKGYRSLVGTFDFKPGLNLVVGENEAGKSTLHDAFVRSMFGFEPSERRKYRGTSTRDECRPWNGRTFGLVASVRDARGHDYRVEWDFDAHSVRLFEGGVDLSSQVRGKHDDISLGSFLLDVGLEDFRQVCCIQQVSLEAVRSSATLGVALQEAVAQIGGDVAAQDVLTRLDGFLRDSIGARVDTFAPTPRGRLGALIAERTTLEQQIETDESVRAQVAELAQQLELNRSESARMAAGLERARQRLLAIERDEAEASLTEARRLTEESEKRVPAHEGPSDQGVDAIRAGVIRLEALSTRIATVNAEVETSSERVEELARAERQLDSQVARLESYADVDTSAHAHVGQALVELESLLEATQSVPDPAPTPDPLLSRYREERLSLVALSVGAKRWTWRRVLWTALVVLTLGLAWLVRLVVRRIRGIEPNPSELDTRLAEYGVTSLAELDRRLAEEDRERAAADARAELAKDQDTKRKERSAQLERDLEAALDDSGASPAETLDDRARGYVAACEKHNERTSLELDLERVKNELQVLRQPTRTLRDLTTEQAELERELRDRYSALGIEPADLATARQALEKILEDVEAAKRSNQNADAAAQALASVLSGGTVELLEARAAETARAHSEHVARFGQQATMTGDVSRLKREISDDAEEMANTRDRVTELETRISDLEASLGSRAELEERLGECRARIVRLERAKEAIRLAKAVIRDAAEELNREFQPLLKEALCRNLPRITGGRHSEALVDGELNVHVVIAGVGRQVSVEQLSRATRDQIFLVQRLEIARLLAPVKGNAPLVLDDPFAHYDAKRLRFGLEMLEETAHDRQVIVFSEDAELPRRAEDVCDECHVIELPPPLPSSHV